MKKFTRHIVIFIFAVAGLLYAGSFRSGNTHHSHKKNAAKTTAGINLKTSNSSGIYSSEEFSDDDFKPSHDIKFQYFLSHSAITFTKQTFTNDYFPNTSSPSIYLLIQSFKV